MALIEELKIGDGIVVKDKNGIRSYKQVVNFAYKGYKVKEYGNDDSEIKRVEQCDVLRKMTKAEEKNKNEKKFH